MVFPCENIDEFWEDIWIPFTNFLKEEIIENQKLFDDIRGTTLDVVHEGGALRSL